MDTLIQQAEDPFGPSRATPARLPAVPSPAAPACPPAQAGRHGATRRVRAGAGRLAAILALAAAGLLATPASAGAPAAGPAEALLLAAATPAAVPTPDELSKGTRTAPDGTASVPPAPGQVPRELGKPQEEMSIDVTAYAVADSAPAQLRAQLARITQPFVGKGRTYEDLVNAASEVTRFLQRDLGYYLGYAYIPEQSPDNGVVRIGVLEGRLDHVELVWSEGLPVKQSVVQGYLDHLHPGDILTVRDVERTVFLVNDLRGITVRAEVKPGEQPGTAVLVFTPKADPRVTGKIGLDNEGSRFIGETRGGVTLNLNSPLGYGDGLVASELDSIEGGLKFDLVGYASPVGSDGMRAGVNYSMLHYDLERQDFPLGQSGDGQVFNAFAMYPLVRSRNLNVFVLGSLDRKKYRDTASVLSTRRHIHDLAAELTGDFRDSLLTGAVNTFDLTLEGGNLGYENGFPPGLDDAQDFRKIDYSFSRLQNVVTNRLLFFASLRGQYSFQNLDTTEQFRLGGPDGVRGFAPGEGTGDTGELFTAELRFLPPEAWLGRWAREMFFAAFVDDGHIQFRRDPSLITRAPGYQNTTRLGAAGLSMVWARPNAYSLRLSVAHVTHGASQSDTVVRSPRAYLQGALYF